MGRRASVLILVIINVIVTLVVVFVAVSFINSQNASQPTNRVVITVPVLITATQNPNQTEQVRIITASPAPGTPGVVQLPTGLIDDFGGTFEAATSDLSAIAGDSSLQETATSLPPHCILYTIKDGDTPYGIATEYNIDGDQLLAVNGLDQQSASFLQIGQVLIVPLPGCDLAAVTPQATAVPPTDTPTEGPSPTNTSSPVPASQTASPTVKPTASSTPTQTLPATATNAQVEIVRVISPGDINAEGVDIRNNGAVVDLTGWKLSNASGTSYTFPQQRLFTGSVLTVYTRVGTDTPTAKFWGLDKALWSSGATLTLTDASGKVQSTYIVP
ncbi:MAG TPA: lamin tail domain-containing protein [Phototrophicaceae bacterium]|nr:lamin tail domain-containing protein [Phototrophicaceae bacterium]